MKPFRLHASALAAAFGLALSAALAGCAANATGTRPPETPARPASSTAVPGPPGAPQVAPHAEPSTSVPAPESERITLTFRATPIDQVFYMLSRNGGVNIVLSKNVAGNVSVNLSDVTVKEAIHEVARAAGYWVEMRGRSYYILGTEAGVDYPATNTRVKTLKVHYSDTRQVADLLLKYASRYGKITPLIGRKMIVVEDLPGFVERIEVLLEQLDVPPRQIMIEAKILEVTLDESERFGVDWKRIFGSAPGTTGSLGTTGLAAGTAAAPQQGFFFRVLDTRLEVFLSALAAKGRVRTLSTPKLLALENQEAKAIIGDSTGYKVTTTINLVTTESIQFLESGIILKVTPSIDQKGRVVLKVQPEVSTASLTAGIPSKKSTQVTTELISEDGQSIFIGGLMKARSSLERSGIPILGDLPVIGNVFSNTSESISTTETVVVITPYIVQEPRDAAPFTDLHLRQLERAAETFEGQEIKLQVDQRLNLQRRSPLKQ